MSWKMKNIGTVNGKQYNEIKREKKVPDPFGTKWDIQHTKKSRTKPNQGSEVYASEMTFASRIV